MQTYQIHCSSHKVISHAGTILTPSPSHEHDAMLLHIVPYVTTQLAKQSFITNIYPSVTPACPPPPLLGPVTLLRPPNRDNHLPTFPGNVTTDRPPATQPNPRHFPLRRIRLLRLEIVDDPQTYTLHVRSIYQRWRHGMTGSLGLAGLFQHLHQGCGEGGCC